ncbi:MAG: hypothetical protein IPP40_18100 [bacterium]|nr:hypothetical protein [bacterium]
MKTSVARAEALFVRGAVSGEWAAPIDTVVIDSFAWVAQAETLNIAPGMVVAFSGRFSLVVNGTLLANGTNEDSIRVQRTPSCTGRPFGIQIPQRSNGFKTESRFI